MKLGNTISKALSATVLLAMSTAGAQVANTVSDNDVRQLVAHFRTFTYTLQQPVTVYHWFKPEEKSKPWTTGKVAINDPAGYERIREAADGFWPSRTAKADDADPYGIEPVGKAFYANLDPVPAYGYGGEHECEGDGGCGGGAMSGEDFGKDWVLLETQIPKGFRVLNHARESSNSVPLQIEQILQMAGCPEIWATNSKSMFSDLFSLNDKVSVQCRALIETVFRQKLGIEALLVSGSSSYFDECKAPTAANVDETGEEYGSASSKNERQLRFAIISAARLTPAHVKVFTAKTTEEPERRLKIQSLFYKTLTDRVMPELSKPASAWSWVSSQIYGKYPRYQTVDEKCEKFVEGQGCVGKVKICKTSRRTGEVNMNHCKVVDIPKAPSYPVVMSSKTPPAPKSEGMGKALLWADLEGKQADAGVGSFVKENFFGCSAGLPYLRKANR